MENYRKSSWFRRLRRTAFVHDVVRPGYSRRLLVDWWQKGRPNPPPHEVKLWAILYLADSIGAKNLIETGSYLGDTVRALRGRFDLIASIELARALALPLQAEFGDDPKVRIIIGDSGVELKRLLPQLSGPSVFWLDAHYSGGPTVGDGSVPILAEIDAIAKAAPRPHAILVDDLKDFSGTEGYPTITQLHDRLRGLGYDVAMFNNMMHAVVKKSD
jgi:hypothetical protein